MDKFNFVRDGGTKLPPGFRFQPTEEEIVFQYLARKIFSCPLPAAVIPEIDNIFSFDPWDLPGESEKDKYLFSKRNVKRGNRATCGGYWRVIGLGRQICSKRMPIVGMRKTLVFCKGNNSCTPDWFMHLYCISLPTNPSCNSQQGYLIQIGKWDLCHIFLKKRSTKAGVCNNEWLRKYGDSIMTAVEGDADSDSDSSCTSSSSSYSSDFDSYSIGLSDVSSSSD